jgi:hypothetical protein
MYTQLQRSTCSSRNLRQMAESWNTLKKTHTGIHLQYQAIRQMAEAFASPPTPPPIPGNIMAQGTCIIQKISLSHLSTIVRQF